jgi:hypothetical protein
LLTLLSVVGCASNVSITSVFWDDVEKCQARDEPLST